MSLPKATDATNAKNATQNALTKTGQSYTWNSKMSGNLQGQLILASDITHLRGGVDKAHNALNYGCSGRFASDKNANHADYGTYYNDHGNNSSDNFARNRDSDKDGN